MTVQPPQVIYNGQPLTASVNIPATWYAYKDVDLWVGVTALGGAPTTGTFDVKIQHKHPREGSNWLDITNKAITQVTEGTSLPYNEFIHLDETDLNSEDIRIVVTIAFSGGTAPSWTVDMTAILRL